MEKLEVFSPHDQSHIQTLNWNTWQDIELWLNKAQLLHQQNKYPLSLNDRLDKLEQLKARVQAEKEDFAKIASLEGGKPIVDSRIEIGRAIEGIGLTIKYMQNMKDPQKVPMNLNEASKNKKAHVEYVPIGVVAAISAFNHPLNLIIHQVIPAIALGCPVIIKPALTTPLTCEKIIEIIHRLGIPESVCKMVICQDDVSEKLATHSAVNYLSFIGSQKVGWHLRSKIAPGTRIGLEHGGTASAILHESVDIQKAIPGLVKGGYYHAGQVCVSVQKIFVPKHLSHAFQEAFMTKVNALKSGNPLDENTQVGPLITPKETKRVENWIDEAIEEGAICLCGGEKLNDFYYQPTILLNPSKKSKVSTHEIFGPVVCIYEYENFEEIIYEINGSDYHFQTAIYGSDLEAVGKYAKQIHTATILINEHTAFRVDWMPFGGQKKSGLGLGGIPYTLKEYSENKLVIYNDIS